MGQLIPLSFRPGSMLTDIVETDLGPFQYQEIRNFRIVRDGEWDSVKGYINIKTGFTDLRAGAEYTEDASADRFLLLQDGTSIKRVDYDVGDGNGYENETPSTLSLPSAVTIGASAVLRFHYHNGIIRISGASEPLWYGYVNRTFFKGSADEFTDTAWVLEKEKILWPAGTNNLQLLEATGIYLVTPTANDPSYTLFAMFFYQFDDGQYELLKNIDDQSGNQKQYGFAEEFKFDDDTGALSAIPAALGGQLKLRVNGSTLKANMFNKRVTGVGIALTRKQLLPITGAEAYNRGLEVFYVRDILPISTAMEEISFVWERVEWDTATPTVLLISDPVGGFFLRWENGYLGEGVSVTIDYQGNELTRTITAINMGDHDTKASITFDSTIASIFGTTGAKLLVGVRVHRKWLYDAANGYSTYIGIHVDALGTAFEDFTDINQFATNINCNWRDHFVIDQRAFVSSRETDEKDQLRFSPINQFDVFPADNIISSEVGDTDEIVRAVKRGDRFTILKNRSLSQGALAGSTYSEHVGLAHEGLFSENGVLELDQLLYFIDKEDCYVFDGNSAPRRLFENAQLQKFYKDNVTNASFIIYNKEDGELWFFLSTKILVWQFKYNNFYLRDTDVTPKFWFLNQENQLFVAASTKIVSFNHSSATFGESLAPRIIMKQSNLNTPRWHKKLKEVETYLQVSSGVQDAIDIKVNDLHVYTITKNHVTAGSSLLARVTPIKRLFKNLTLTLDLDTAFNNLSMQIREIRAIVEVWKA